MTQRRQQQPQQDPGNPIDQSEAAYLRGRVATLEGMIENVSRVMVQNNRLLAEALQLLNHRQDASDLRFDDLYEAVDTMCDHLYDGTLMCRRHQRVSADEALVMVARHNLDALDREAADASASATATTPGDDSSTQPTKDPIVAPPLVLVSDDDATQVYEFGGEGSRQQ